jgi:negative regulator of flagellin synthesis FlgM
MVEPLGVKPATTGDLRIGAVTRVAQAAPTRIAPQLAEPAQTTLAAQMAAKAPVDADRVRAIKDAVAQGRFPLSPATIADRLIAARYEWMYNDQA